MLDASRFVVFEALTTQESGHDVGGRDAAEL
jgi:hypothetical protein